MNMEKFAKNSAPECPLCGAFLEQSGQYWYCPNNEEHATWLERQSRAAYEAQQNGAVVFFTDLRCRPQERRHNWNPELQGVILAILETPEIVWCFCTTRGRNGRSDFSIRPLDGESNYAPPPRGEWVWADWVTIP